MGIKSLQRRLKHLESRLFQNSSTVLEYYIKKRMIVLKGGNLPELGKSPEVRNRISSDSRVIDERIKRRKANL